MVSPLASPRTLPGLAGRLYMRAICTCIGPAIRSWRSGSLMPCMLTPRAVPNGNRKRRTPSVDPRTRRFMIFTTMETGMLPKGWWIWPSMSASQRPRIGSARSSIARPCTSPRTQTPMRPPRPLPRPTTSRSIRSCRLPEGRKPSPCWLAPFVPIEPLIIHPQFTEPEAALIAAGHQPQRLILSPATGFRLHLDLVPSDADLVVIGNPTNPTGVLHPAALINSLRQAERLLVVDEAFMDAVPGETETLISDDLTGVVILRSLTKTWGLAGLRAGYVIGDPKLIAALRRQQPPWSVSTPALAAIVACLTPNARSLAAEAAEEIAGRRAYLIEQLADLGLRVAGQPSAPFVLVDTSGVREDREPGWIRLALRDHGFAVRRGETFPGLGPDWIRIAVREPEVTDQLVAALGRLVRI